ncbi:MAG: hypothetical protein Kow00129_13930 [Thermoleophilia bacterium]
MKLAADIRPLRTGLVGAWGPVGLWLCVIAVLSSDLASRSTTEGGLLEVLAQVLPALAEPVGGLLESDTAMTLVRKSGHLVEYGLLAFLVVRALGLTTGIGPLRAAGLAVAFSLLVASLDELNQSTLPSRTGTPLDVLVDGLGAVAGAWLGLRLRRGPAAFRRED